MTPSQRLDQIEPVIAELIVKVDFMEKKVDNLTQMVLRMSHIVEKQGDDLTFLLKGQMAMSGKINKIEGRLDKIEGRIDKIELRLDKMDDRLDKIDDRLDKIDDRLDKIDDRLDKMDERFDKMDERFDKLDASVNKIALTQDAILAILSKN